MGEGRGGCVGAAFAIRMVCTDVYISSASMNALRSYIHTLYPSFSLLWFTHTPSWRGEVLDLRRYKFMAVFLPLLEKKRGGERAEWESIEILPHRLLFLFHLIKHCVNQYPICLSVASSAVVSCLILTLFYPLVILSFSSSFLVGSV